MLKVLIVDDDLLVRANLKNMLDWEADGFSLCGEAANGADALRLIEKKLPDIILSDMRMPVIDGLELSSRLKLLYPESALIVLSNYDDFEYVKGTLKNGAIDYILKHNLNKATLSEALQRAKAIIGKNKASMQAKHYSFNNILALKQDFLMKLLTGFYKSDDEIRQQLKILDIRLSDKTTLAVVMVIDDYTMLAAKKNLQEISLLEATVINITEEILNDSGNGEIFHLSNARYVLIFSFKDLHSSAAINSMLNAWLDRINACLKKFINITVSFSIGPLCSGISNIYKSYEDADRMLEKRFYEGKSCILWPTGDKIISSQLTGLEIEKEHEIIRNLFLPDKRDLVNTMNSIFQEIKSSRPSSVNSHAVFSDLLSIVKKLCRDKALDASRVYSGDEAPHIMLSRLETLDDIKTWISGIFERLYAALNADDSTEAYSEYVKKAVNYIRKYHAGDISLSNVAEAIDISSVYLSKIFKKETGMGFAEYLCDFRLEKAKLLLEEGKEDIRNISSLCGFHNYTYFFNIFKQKKGITPGEYIRTIRK